MLERSGELIDSMNTICQSEAQFKAAFQMAQSGRRDEAQQILQELLVKHPDHPDVLHLMGIILLESGCIAKAQHVLHAALTRRPEEAQFHYHYGLALVRTGDIAGAEKAFSGALALDPKFNDARYNLGKALKDQGDLESAAAVYQDLLDQMSACPKALYNLANLRLEMDQLTEAEALFTNLLAKFPQHLDARTNLALLKNRRGETQAAMQILDKALEIDPTHQGATDLLRRLQSRKIPAWHFDMLNDDKRNEAYHQAISRIAGQVDHVLEIGTGSGLLAMMAARAGAKRVTTCEMSQPLAAVARKVIARNGLTEKIQVVSKKSTQLKIGKDLLEPADLLIAEVYDNGLLGEHFLPALLHAKRNLLKPDAVVIPAAATVYAMLIESWELRRVNPLRRIAGFDLSDFDVFRRPGYRQINLENFNYRALSPPAVACRLDFQNKWPAPSLKHLPVSISQTGVCHAVAFWFDLHLDDVTHISTRNTAHTNHWKQALQFLTDDFRLTAGDCVKLQVNQKMTSFEFALETEDGTDGDRNMDMCPELKKIKTDVNNSIRSET